MTLFTVFDNDNREYDIEADNVKVTETMVEFYDFTNKLIGAFKLSDIIGFIREKREEE